MGKKAHIHRLAQQEEQGMKALQKAESIAKSLNATPTQNLENSPQKCESSSHHEEQAKPTSI